MVLLEILGTYLGKIRNLLSFGRKLTDHHRLLYELIVKKGGILSGNLWRLYMKTCQARDVRPIAVRT